MLVVAAVSDQACYPRLELRETQQSGLHNERASSDPPAEGRGSLASRGRVSDSPATRQPQQAQHQPHRAQSCATNTCIPAKVSIGALRRISSGRQQARSGLEARRATACWTRALATHLVHAGADRSIDRALESVLGRSTTQERFATSSIVQHIYITQRSWADTEDTVSPPLPGHAAAIESMLRTGGSERRLASHCGQVSLCCASHRWLPDCGIPGTPGCYRTC